jgi:hypothetical protein
MYATVRRYEGIDKVRSEEVTRKVATACCRGSASCLASAATT